VRRRTGEDLLPPRLLAWYPRAAISSGVLEALIAHHDGRATERVLKLVRMAVSFTVECPFCVGLNSEGWDRLITEDELRAVQGIVELDRVDTFTSAEQLAIEYARLASQTPLKLGVQIGEQLRAEFSEREIVVLASTIAQVNYWARFIQGLGCPPTG
jgi:alkylhydroperoxidase family enzyme